MSKLHAFMHVNICIKRVKIYSGVTERRLIKCTDLMSTNQTNRKCELYPVKYLTANGKLWELCRCSVTFCLMLNLHVSLSNVLFTNQAM